MNTFELKKRLEQRRGALMQTKQRMEPHWKSLREYIQPFRGRFGGERPEQTTPSLGSILSSEALRARRTLAAGMQSGLTSPSRQWFKLTTHDPELSERQDVIEWCDDVQRRMMTVMAGSSFYHALHSVYDEIAVFGTGAMTIMPDYDNVMQCRALTAGTYCLGKGASDTIDTMLSSAPNSAATPSYRRPNATPTRCSNCTTPSSPRPIPLCAGRGEVSTGKPPAAPTGCCAFPAIRRFPSWPRAGR